ncbi:hypothetical protein C8Q79DRAFT_1099915, partial [Trametes meyenii]
MIDALFRILSWFGLQRTGRQLQSNGHAQNPPATLSSYPEPTTLLRPPELTPHPSTHLHTSIPLIPAGPTLPLPVYQPHHTATSAGFDPNTFSSFPLHYPWGPGSGAPFYPFWPHGLGVSPPSNASPGFSLRPSHPGLDVEATNGLNISSHKRVPELVYRSPNAPTKSQPRSDPSEVDSKSMQGASVGFSGLKAAASVEAEKMIHTLNTSERDHRAEGVVLQTAEQKALDERNWPQGECRREKVLDEREAVLRKAGGLAKRKELNNDWKANCWVWSSQGDKKRHGMMLFKCDAITYHFYEEDEDGVFTDIWEHSGIHGHPRPPRNGHCLSKAETQAIEAQVLRRPEASAHQLRTGDSAPGSVPLAEISPVLADPRRARYQVNQARESLNLRPAASGKGGGSVLKTLSQLNKEFSAPFLVDSGFVDHAFVVMQSPFMALIAEESVRDWINPHDPDKDGRHGVVLDGDHSFFRDGLLITACAFSTTLAAWVPIVYTWVGGQSAQDHRPHFRCLNSTIIRTAGDKFDPKLLSVVMDFSAAQRAAHAEEFAESMISLFENWDKLGPEAKAAQRPTTSDFDRAVHSLRDEFPRFSGWISWWLQPLVSRMLFPVKQSMSEADARALPRTSNPVETQHSLLHHASGKAHDLIPGIRGLFLHCQELQRRHQAIRGRLAWFYIPTMDGHQTLLKLLRRYNLDQINLSKRHQSYSLRNNSCFTDHPMEAWFRAYIMLPPSVRTSILSDTLPRDSTLASIFFHFDARLKWILAGSDALEGWRLLGLCQSIIKHAVFRTWGLVEHINAFGCTHTWIERAVQSTQSDNTLRMFAIHHFAQWSCPNGHLQEDIIPLPVIYSLRMKDVRLATTHTRRPAHSSSSSPLARSSIATVWTKDQNPFPHTVPGSSLSVLETPETVADT